MYRLLVLSCLIFSFSAYGEGLKRETSFDLGIGIAPALSPETGYKDASLRFGIEFGATLYKYEDDALFSIKGVTQPPRTTFKLLRFGGAIIDNKPTFLFSPISVYLKDKAYLSPTFSFGENPYTVFSFTYELLP